MERQELNERRLQLLQRDPNTHYSDQGVIAIDDPLIDHDGKFIKDVGWFWDHAEDRHKIVVPAEGIDALVKRYERDFPEHVAR